MNAFAAHPLIPPVQHNLAEFERVAAPRGALAQIMKTLSSASLQALLGSLKTHKEGPRIDILCKKIFEQDFHNIVSDRLAMDTVEMTLSQAVRVAFTTDYYDMGFDWKRYESDVLAALLHTTRADGAATAIG